MSNLTVRSSGMFWGLLFLVIGLVIVLQTLFNINLPLLRILLGTFLIYWGVKVILGGFGMQMSGFKLQTKSTDSEIVFGEKTFSAFSKDQKRISDFSNAFGEANLDLTHLPESEVTVPITINNAFGEFRIQTNPDWALDVVVDSAFSSVRIRNAKVGSFGTTETQLPGQGAESPRLKLRIKTGFGQVVVDP